MIRRNGDGQDPAEAVGRVLTAKRAALLRAYRDRLLPDDLEDCLSQATLELVARARREALAGDRHSFVGLLRVCALSLIWEQRNPGDRLHRGTPSVALNLSGRRRTTPQRVTRWRAAPRRTHLRLSFEANLADVGAQETVGQQRDEAQQRGDHGRRFRRPTGSGKPSAAWKRNTRSSAAPTPTMRPIARAKDTRLDGVARRLRASRAARAWICRKRSPGYDDRGGRQEGVAR